MVTATTGDERDEVEGLPSARDRPRLQGAKLRFDLYGPHAALQGCIVQAGQETAQYSLHTRKGGSASQSHSRRSIHLKSRTCCALFLFRPGTAGSAFDRPAPSTAGVSEEGEEVFPPSAATRIFGR